MILVFPNSCIQCHTLNFSPARYWITMYFWDLFLYWMLVGLMSCTIIGILYLAAPYQYLHYKDLCEPFTFIAFTFIDLGKVEKIRLIPEGRAS